MEHCVHIHRFYRQIVITFANPGRTVIIIDHFSGPARAIAPLCVCVRTITRRKLEMWANARRDGRPAEYRWRLCSTPQSLADAHY